MICIEQASICAVMKMIELSVTGRLLYAASLMIPDSTVASLVRDMGKDRGTLCRCCHELEKAGLVRLTRTRDGFKVLPLIPIGVEKDLAHVLSERVATSGYRGEAQSFGWLDTLVWDPDYIDCFRPGYIRNPTTKRPLEYDRIYPKKRVATEFQGSQHYRLTELFPDEDKLSDTRLRDLVKLGLSVEKGITVITLEPKDLSLKGMLAKIGDLLPLRPYNPSGPLITTLEKLGRQYNASVARQEQEAEMASERTWH